MFKVFKQISRLQDKWDLDYIFYILYNITCLLEFIVGLEGPLFSSGTLQFLLKLFVFWNCKK